MDSEYADIFDRLTPEARSLLGEMVERHLDGSGDRRFVLSSTFGPKSLTFVCIGSPDPRKQESFPIDHAALIDLVKYELVAEDHAADCHRVNGDTLHFYQWMMRQEGSSVEQVEADSRRLVGTELLAAAHPSAARHLSEAFDSLWNDDLTDATTSSIGDHLRKAIMDLTTDLVGPGASGKQEYPIKRLEKKLEAMHHLGTRETAVLVALIELARVTLSLDHRLNHVRDESDRGKEPVTADENRRAAFTTAFVCAELSRALRRE